MRATGGVAGLLAAVLGLTANPAFAGGQAGTFESSYMSTVIEKDGEPHPLFEGATVEVNFFDESAMNFHVRCGTYGWKVKVTERRLIMKVSGVLGEGCPPRERVQDKWLIRFFCSDPRWRARGTGLRLFSEGRVIRLERSASRTPQAGPQSRLAQTTRWLPPGSCLASG